MEVSVAAAACAAFGHSGDPELRGKTRLSGEGTRGLVAAPCWARRDARSDAGAEDPVLRRCTADATAHAVRSEAGAVDRDDRVGPPEPKGVAPSPRAVEIARPTARRKRRAPPKAVGFARRPCQRALGLIAAFLWTEGDAAARGKRW